MQQSLDEGMVYGGTVTLPKELAECAWNLIIKADLRFGRSRSAQYSACSLIEAPRLLDCTSDKKEAAQGEMIYVVLESDLLTAGEGMFQTSHMAARQEIAYQLGMDWDDGDALMCDRLLYHDISGYHAMWMMQKPQMRALRGGSVFVFRAKQDMMIPEQLQVGEYPQEGFGMCRVFRQRDLNCMTIIRESGVDSSVNALEKNVGGKREGQAAVLKNALLFQELCRKAEEYAAQYGRKNGKELDKALIGRIRRMTESSVSYGQMLGSIRDMKESDRSSETIKTRKEKTALFVQGLCGNGRAEAGKLLGSSEALGMAGEEKEVTEKLCKEWKRFLMYALHTAYYEQGGK